MLANCRLYRPTGLLAAIVPALIVIYNDTRQSATDRALVAIYSLSHRPRTPIMRCPACRNDNDRVIDSRGSEEGYVIRRRRECMSCGRRFTTYERLEGHALKVIKKDDVREPFDVEKIRQGLAKACWKRPVSDEAIETVIAAIEREAYDEYESEIASRELGELVMQHLVELDQVAFVRFASVYREFKDVRDFVAELEPMLDDTDRDESQT